MIGKKPNTISKTLWKKIGPQGRAIYTDVMGQSQSTMNPAGHRLPGADWEVIKHNFAVTAAFAAKKNSSEVPR